MIALIIDPAKKDIMYAFLKYANAAKKDKDTTADVDFPKACNILSLYMILLICISVFSDKFDINIGPALHLMSLDASIFLSSAKDLEYIVWGSRCIDILCTLEREANAFEHAGKAIINPMVERMDIPQCVILKKCFDLIVIVCFLS